jgi:hypothetical protein
MLASTQPECSPLKGRTQDPFLSKQTSRTTGAPKRQGVQSSTFFKLSASVITSVRWGCLFAAVGAICPASRTRSSLTF